MESDQYNLRWHYHHAETFLAFESLRRADSFVDVVLSCEKRSIFAHKLVLSACSNYFFDVLRSVRENQTPVLFFRDTAMELLEYVVHYMYHGEVEVPSARITDFISLAEALEIKGLKRQDGFTAEGPSIGNPMSASSASPIVPGATYAGMKREYGLYDDSPPCHAPPPPPPQSAAALPPTLSQGPPLNPSATLNQPPTGETCGEDYTGNPPESKRLRESNFSPTYQLSSRRSSSSSSLMLSSSHGVASKDVQQDVKGDFWGERPEENYSNQGPSSCPPGNQPGFVSKSEGEGHRPANIPPQISTAAPITQVAQVIWRGTDLNNRVLYFCEVCLYKTTKNSNAFAHERRHTQEKPFVCACGKAYKAPHPLRVHKQSCPVGGGGGSAGGDSPGSRPLVHEPHDAMHASDSPPSSSSPLPHPPHLPPQPHVTHHPHHPVNLHHHHQQQHQPPPQTHLAHHAVHQQHYPQQQQQHQGFQGRDHDEHAMLSEVRNYSQQDCEGDSPPLMGDPRGEGGDVSGGYSTPGVLDLKENLR